MKTTLIIACIACASYGIYLGAAAVAAAIARRRRVKRNIAAARKTVRLHLQDALNGDKQAAWCINQANAYLKSCGV